MSISTTTLNDEQVEVSTKLVTKMIDLGHNVQFIRDQISVGPVVSVYRFAPKGNTKVSNIEALSEDFAIALGAEDVLVKRIPGESYVSIWVPNKTRRYVNWRDTIKSLSALSGETKIPLNLGVDHLGRPCILDLSVLPHLLIAGSTGSGKSTLLVSVLASLIYCKRSDEVQFILSDTKGVEFGYFEGAPHLLFPPATTVYQTLERIDWLIAEMKRRLRIYGNGGFRNINEYNKANDNRKHPSIALVIDELADLLGDSSRGSAESGPSLGKVSSQKLSELARKARASGIHIIASTQRPSTKVVNGDIKANFPARLCLRVPSGVDSRTVLATEGAEHLLSRGDMLYIDPARPGLHRIHAPICDNADIQGAVAFARGREA